MGPGQIWQMKEIELAKRIKPALILCLLLTAVLFACARPGARKYDNKTFGFSVNIPSDYKIKEYTLVEQQTGLELRRETGIIDIRVNGAGTMYADMPFDEYVKIAAMAEIQNYEKLVSIEAFTSNRGVKGYKTYWEVIETIPPDEWEEGMEPRSEVVGPIYYFPPKGEHYIVKQPVKTIMFSHYAYPGGETKTLQDLIRIVKSFKHI